MTTHPEVHPATIFANFEKFGERGLDIYIYFFTKTTVWGEWLQAREGILFQMMEILEDEGVSIALPSRTIYNKPSPSPQGTEK